MNTFLFRWMLVIGMAFGINAGATIRYVDLNNTQPTSPYTNWLTAATNIQAAIDVAQNGDLILVTNGVYQTGGRIDNGTSNRVDIFKPVTVQSVNGPDATIIQGYQMPGTTNGPTAIRCVYLANGATLSGFTLTHGATAYSEYGGGGANCASTNAFLTNCIVAGNVSYSFAGGVYSGTLINCTLSNNFAGPPTIGSGGGAAYSILKNCVVSGNRSGYIGGGAFSSTLINCTVVSNNAGAYDGGISSSTALNSIIYYNLAYYDTLSVTSSVGTLYFTNCCLAPWSSSGFNNNFTNPPNFTSLDGGDFHLQWPSPCMNTGSNALNTLGSDRDGNPRVVGSSIDVGAYEFQPTIRYVNMSNATPVSPFLSWSNAATTIQDAIDVAGVGELIVVSNGNYKVGGRAVYGNMTNRVTIDKALTVQSVNGPDRTLIEGKAPIAAYPTRCVYLTNGAALIGFALTNGTALTTGDFLREQSGAGAWCEGANSILSNCVVTAGFAPRWGGGVLGGTLFNCVLTNNVASRGGGGYSNVLNGCTLVKNRANFQNLDSGAGALYSTLNDCFIINNEAGGGGGGGASFSSLNRCIISNNVANIGGGVCMSVANNCLIYTNRSNSGGPNGSGGGAYSSTLNNCVLKNNNGQFGAGASLGTLNNCTVVSNAATGSGGGVLNAEINNSIVYYNSCPKNENYAFDFGSTNAMRFTCTFPMPTNGLGNITNEPAFINVVSNLRLQSNSPCINSGSNLYTTNSLDLDGNPRIRGGTVDMGAYEFQSPTSVLSYAWAQQYGLPTDGSADYADNDNDGLSNWQEWQTGTSPTDAGSPLLLFAPIFTNAASGVTISWKSAAGTNYFLHRSTNLSDQPPFTVLATNIVGQQGITTYDDMTATNEGPYFYRVGVQ